jgi:hypothetical protein
MLTSVGAQWKANYQQKRQSLSHTVSKVCNTTSSWLYLVHDCILLFFKSRTCRHTYNLRILLFQHERIHLTASYITSHTLDTFISLWWTLDIAIRVLDGNGLLIGVYSVYILHNWWRSATRSFIMSVLLGRRRDRAIQNMRTFVDLTRWGKQASDWTRTLRSLPETQLTPLCVKSKDEM